MTLEEMKARLAEAQEALRSLHEGAGDEPLGERQGEWDELTAEVSQLRSDIAAIEARQATVRELGERKVKDEAPAYVRSRTDAEVYDLDALRMESNSPEDFVRRAGDNAKRAIERAEFGRRDGVSKEAMHERAEMLIDTVDNQAGDLAKRMLITGSKDYERAFTKVMRHGTDAFCTNEERQALLRAQSLGTDNQGGYAVPFQLDPTVILTSAGVVNPIREMARVETIVGKEWQGVTTAGTTVSRDAEAAEVSDDSFELGQPTVRTKRVQGFVPFSIEVDLSWSALRSEITRVLVDAKEAEEDSFVTGDATGNLPQGINAGLVGASQDVNTAAIDTFAVADLYALEEALAPRWERNASWLAHKSVYNAIRQFDTSGGANLWTRIGDGTPRRLIDYPDYRSSAMPSLTTAKGASAGTANAAVMLFGDFKQFLIVDRIGMTVELIPHLFGENQRPTGQRGVYAVWMNNSKILVPSAFKRLVMKQS
jgi:HK97 family phage major capsid protein